MGPDDGGGGGERNVKRAGVDWGGKTGEMGGKGNVLLQGRQGGKWR